MRTITNVLRQSSREETYIIDPLSSPPHPPSHFLLLRTAQPLSLQDPYNDLFEASQSQDPSTAVAKTARKHHKRRFVAADGEVILKQGGHC